MPGVKEQPIKSFSTAAKWRDWLEKNSANSPGLRLRLFKKTSGKRGVTYDEALDEALCYGWIDGQVNKYDDLSYLQKFTPRRPRGTWSKRNREHVARLTKEGRMAPAGLKEVEAAKKDGRWDAAYDSPSNMEIPADFLETLQNDRRAYEFFKTLNKANTYAIAWRLATAKKPETRQRRMKVLLEMLSQGKKIH